MGLVLALVKLCIVFQLSAFKDESLMIYADFVEVFQFSFDVIDGGGFRHVEIDRTGGCLHV